MTRDLIDLNLLRAFDALFTERHVTRAARRLGLGQPAMSGALARLRVALGDELFVRAADGMQPTPKALRIAPGVARSLADLSRTLEVETPFDPGAARKTFTLASSDYTTFALLPGLMALLRAEAPDVDLRVVGYDKPAVAGMLDRGEIDAALGVFPDPPDRCVATPLFEERFVGVARANHPALASGPPGLAAFLALPHALATLKRDAHGALDDALAAVGERRRIALAVPHLLALPAILRASDLVTALPTRVASSLNASDLAIFALPVQADVWTVSMLWNPHARSDAAAAWFRARVAAAA